MMTAFAGIGPGWLADGHSPHRRYSECGLVFRNGRNCQINYWSLLKDLSFAPPHIPPLLPT